VLNNFSRSSRRILALLILFALPAILAAVTLVPLHTVLTNYDENIADLEFRLQKYQRMAQLEMPLKAQLKNLTSKQESAEGLLQGESQAIAGANLQELFKQIVRGGGGRLESTQILPGSASGVMDRIGIRAQFSGDIDSLHQVLHDIEFNKPILFVDKIEIRSKRIRRSRRKPTPASRAQILSVSLEISGYRRNEEAI